VLLFRKDRDPIKAISEERMEQLKNEVERRCPVLNLLLDAGIKVDTRNKYVHLKRHDPPFCQKQRSPYLLDMIPL
jgi:hypothetical protein